MGKKTFTRPEGWEKTIKSKYFDDSKTFDGDSYEEMRKKKKKESTTKAKEGMFESLRRAFSSKK